MGRLLGVVREWVSKLENGHQEFSEFVRLKLTMLVASGPTVLHALAEEPAAYQARPLVKKLSSVALASAPLSRGPVQFAPGFQPRPPEPTPQACIEHFMAYLKAAEQAPGGVGAVWWKLQKNFPLDEFEPAKK